MTCFWNGIMKSLDIRSSPLEFAKMLKNKAVITRDVTWNNTEISEKQLDENYQRVINLDLNSINNGYDCSTFEPFLFLVSQVFQVDIKHHFMNNILYYKNKIRSIKTITVYSNIGHFWS